MHRTFIKLVLVASVVLSGFGAAAPARADTEDIAKVLAGIAALYLLSEAVRDNNKKKSKKKTVTQNTYRPIPVVPSTRRADRNVLPGECLRRFETRDGDRLRFLGKRCLERNYAYTNNLPRYCRQNIRVGDRVRRGYNPRCLRNDGYRIAVR